MLKMKIKLGTYLVLPRTWYSLGKWRGGRRERGKGDEEEGRERRRREGRGGGGRRRGGEDERGERNGGGRGEGRRGEEKGRGREYSLAEATTAPPPHMSCSIGVTKAVVELGMRLVHVVYRYTPF